MNTPEALLYCSNIRKNHPSPFFSYTSISKFVTYNERKIMKVFLLNSLHRLFCDFFHNKIQSEKFYSSMECYAVDKKMIQFFIQSIVETEEYTLEGIANYTRIPFDVILDASCGNNTQLSITLWVKIVDLYLQVKPDVAQLLFNKLIDIKDKNHLALSLLLNE